MFIHCWEDGTNYGHPSHTCLEPNGHSDDHVWVDNRIVLIEFVC